MTDEILKSIARTEAYAKNMFLLYLNNIDNTPEQEFFNEIYRNSIEEDTEIIFRRLKDSIE